MRAGDAEPLLHVDADMPGSCTSTIHVGSGHTLRWAFPPTRSGLVRIPRPWENVPAPCATAHRPRR